MATSFAPDWGLGARLKNRTPKPLFLFLKILVRIVKITVSAFAESGQDMVLGLKARFAMAKILLVEDDRDLCTVISDSLEAQSHTMEMVHTGTEGRERILCFEYDLVILDWDLPKISGIEILREMRDKGCGAHVLMLTGKSETSEKEIGLDYGADDYLTKPFALKELQARIRALLRRPQGFTGTQLSACNLLLDPNLHKLSRNGEEIKLLPKEFALLEFFMRHKGQIFTAEAVLNRVWSSESEASPESFRTCLKRLRQKIDLEGKESIIEYVNGLGYRISD